MSLKNLNKVQRAAVETVGVPQLVFAGAGSGKTRVITHKIAYLIQQKQVPAEDILAVTFTNKAAGEMRERVRRLLKSDRINLQIGTFHAICARLLREEIQRLGFRNDFVIYDVTDQISLLKIVMDGSQVPKDFLSPQAAHREISLLKNRLVTSREALDSAHNRIERTLAEVYGDYQKALKANNAVDFDDLLIHPLTLFDNYATVLKKYQNRWKVILVDEYQDTNRPQFLFVSRLAEKHRHICVVGDDDQSIYGWRGADVHNILEFEKTFPDCQVFKLERNYRSTKTILSAATAVIRHNELRADKELISVGGVGKKIGLIETQDEMEEADAVVSAIEKEIKIDKRSFSHFAILYRTNAQSRALEESLQRAGIPYNIVGGIRFYERKEVKDLLAYLRLCINLDDTISLRRVINFPPRGIGSKTIDKCVRQTEATGKRLVDVLCDPEAMDIRGKQADSLILFHDIVKKYHELQEKLSGSELARALVDETGFIKFYRETGLKEDRERIKNIEELLIGVDTFSARYPDSLLRDFLEEVSLLTDIDAWNDQANRVTLMTAHSSKGLEFPVIFIAGLEDGLFPLYNSLNNHANLEEERRLFYVALTRAQKKVYLMYANNRRRLGAEDLYGLVSRFVQEIPGEYLENISFASALTRKVVSTSRGTRTTVIRTVTAFDDFKVGDYVEHAIFGVGRIMVLSGSGENQRVGILFKDGQKKKLVAKYAKLKKVENPHS